MKRNLIEKLQIHYSTPAVLDRIKVENKQIPILIFEEAKGRGWGRKLTMKRDRSSKLLYNLQIHLFKCAHALQYMEGENKYDPKQALYTRRVRQLKQRNKYLHNRWEYS